MKKDDYLTALHRLKLELEPLLGSMTYIVVLSRCTEPGCNDMISNMSANDMILALKDTIRTLEKNLGH